MKELLDIKKDFEEVKSLRSDIMNINENLTAKLDVLHKIYADLIKTHGQGEHIFGIDSFYFQNKLIANENNNLMNTFKSIENRIYCEYYKLHNELQKYILNNINDDTVINKSIVKKKYPAYSSLDPFKYYDFSLVLELQSHIINALSELESYRVTRDSELDNDTKQSNMGLNIDNLVHSYRFTNALLKERINMYVNYLQVFHEHHTKYLTRHLLKSKISLGVVNEDIQIKQFNQGSSTAFTDVFSGEIDTPESGNMNKKEEESVKHFVGYENSDGSRKRTLDRVLSSVCISPTQSETQSETQSDTQLESSAPSSTTSSKESTHTHHVENDMKLIVNEMSNDNDREQRDMELHDIRKDTLHNNVDDSTQCDFSADSIHEIAEDTTSEIVSEAIVSIVESVDDANNTLEEGGTGGKSNMDD